MIFFKINDIYIYIKSRRIIILFICNHYINYLYYIQAIIIFQNSFLFPKLIIYYLPKLIILFPNLSFSPNLSFNKSTQWNLFKHFTHTTKQKVLVYYY